MEEARNRTYESFYFVTADPMLIDDFSLGLLQLHMLRKYQMTLLREIRIPAIGKVVGFRSFSRRGTDCQRKNVPVSLHGTRR